MIHIAELYDTPNGRSRQTARRVRQYLVDPDGFVGEGNQPAELGWGTHEKTLPGDGNHHAFGSGATIYLNRRGSASTRVRSWNALGGSRFMASDHA